MDFLTPTINQIRDLFASMTPGARVTAGLLVAVVVVSLGFLFQKATAGPDEYLFGGDPIGRDQLLRMEAAMAAVDIDYTVEGSRIKVARKDRNAAVAAIADKGELPADFHHLMKDALEGGHMFDFKGDKEMRYRHARESQASKILSDFPWVEQANVMISVRNTNSFRGGRKASAAVSIKAAVGETFDTRRVRRVKDFVSKACDVPIDQIAVTNSGSDLLAGGDEISPEDFDHPFYKLKAQTERSLRQKINHSLNYIPGVIVQVTARIDPVSKSETVKITPSEPAIPLRKRTVTESDEQVVGIGGNRVGTEANGPEGIGRETALARQDTNKKLLDTVDTDSVVGTDTEKIVTAGFILKEAEASVSVPISHIERVYRSENPTPEGEESGPIDTTVLTETRTRIKQSVENSIKALLPKLALGQDEYKQVTVEFFRDFPDDPMPEPSLASGAVGFLDSYGNTLAMAGLAVFSLVMLRSMVTGAGKEAESSSMPSLQLDGASLQDGLPDEEEAGEGSRPKLKLRKADTLKDDLTEMVGSDPDAAAAILKSWINNAA